ncbi:MAG: hypothetical protein R6W69_05290, partial [Anaerolineales bacterium]
MDRHGIVCAAATIAALAMFAACDEALNNPPETPGAPTGAAQGNVSVSYEFSATTTDPEGGDIAFRFSWGDGDTSEWTDWTPSGGTASASHAWA